MRRLLALIHRDRCHGSLRAEGAARRARRAALPDFIFPAPETSAPVRDISPRSGGLERAAGRRSGSARSAFSDVRKRTPGSASAAAGLGSSRWRSTTSTAPSRRFDEAVALKPALAAALVGRGLAQAQSNRAADAIASFEAAQAADPTLDPRPSHRGTAVPCRGRAAVAKARTAAAARQSWMRPGEGVRQALVASPDSALLCCASSAAIERRDGQASRPPRISSGRRRSTRPIGRRDCRSPTSRKRAATSRSATAGSGGGESIEHTPPVDARAWPRCAIARTSRSCPNAIAVIPGGVACYARRSRRAARRAACGPAARRAGATEHARHRRLGDVGGAVDRRCPPGRA